MKKKFLISFLFLLILSFNILTLTSLAQQNNIFKEGFYKQSDLALSPKESYTIQNLSKTDTVYVLIFDKNHSLYQSIRMEPTSQKYAVVLPADFRMGIVGNGEVFFS